VNVIQHTRSCSSHWATIGYASISGLLNSFSSVDNRAFSDNSVDPSR